MDLQLRKRNVRLISCLVFTLSSLIEDCRIYFISKRNNILATNNIHNNLLNNPYSTTQNNLLNKIYSTTHNNILIITYSKKYSQPLISLNNIQKNNLLKTIVIPDKYYSYASICIKISHEIDFDLLVGGKLSPAKLSEFSRLVLSVTSSLF